MKADGKIAVFNLTNFTNVLIQGMVMLTISVEIVKVFANYCFMHDGTSEIFYPYQHIYANISRAKANLDSSAARCAN